MADEPSSDAIKPWTIKGISKEDREVISKAADRADLTLGEWLIRAAHLAIRMERDGQTGPTERADREDFAPSPPPPSIGTMSSIEIVERLAAVLPSLTAEDREGRKSVRLARKVIDQHIQALGILTESPTGPTRIAAPAQSVPKLDPAD